MFNYTLFNLSQMTMRATVDLLDLGQYKWNQDHKLKSGEQQVSIKKANNIQKNINYNIHFGHFLCGLSGV